MMMSNWVVAVYHCNLKKKIEIIYLKRYYIITKDEPIY